MDTHLTPKAFDPFSAGDEATPFAEPFPIVEILVTEIMARRFAHGVKFVGWSTALKGDGSFDERRIGLRFAMPERAARKLRADLNDMFKTSNWLPQFRRTFIREWREHRGLTLMQLAERLGVTPSHLSMLERGLRGYTQYSIEHIAAALQTDVATLVTRRPATDEAGPAAAPPDEAEDNIFHPEWKFPLLLTHIRSKTLPAGERMCTGHTPIKAEGMTDRELRTLIGDAQQALLDLHNWGADQLMLLELKDLPALKRVRINTSAARMLLGKLEPRPPCRATLNSF